MKKINKYLVLSLTVMIGLVFTACEDHQARFDEPTWLGGSNIEVLEEEENYSIYLELLERSGFSEAVNTISYTLFVPDNAAFEKYFQENGIEGVDAMSDDEVYQLFSLHILINPRSRNGLIYENAFGQIEDEDFEYAALFFKKQTQSLEATYKELPRYHDTFRDTLTIYSSAKFIPCWSKEYLEDIFSPLDGSDYEFLYPGSDYDSESELSGFAMNWANAKLLPNPDNPEELGIKTSSGFIYPVDQVVSPLPTLEVYLKNQDEYSLFYDLLQRFANYGNARTVGEQQEYKKTYTNEIPLIADERGPKNTGWAPFFMKDYFTALVPQNDILQQYLNDHILPTYGHIDSIPELTLAYLLRAHLNNSMALLSKLEQGTFDNFGSPIVVRRDEINRGLMCSNGAFYDVNKVMEPYAFTSVTEKLFFDSKYSTFLFMLIDNGILSDVITAGDEITLFVCTNDELLEANIRYDPSDSKIYYKGIDEVWRKMDSDYLVEFIRNHISYEKFTDLSGEGFLVMTSGNYVHYNKGKIEGPENQFLNETIDPSLQKETDMGVMYHINVPIKSNYNIPKLLHNDLSVTYAQTLTDTTLTEFSDLLVSSRLLNPRIINLAGEYLPSMNFLNFSEQWTVFAPTNQAIRDARAQGLIPTGRADLTKWINYHFVPNRVILDNGDSNGSGSFNTFLAGETVDNVIVYEKLKITNVANNLQLVDKTGQIVNVDHSMANMLTQKGVVHKINTVLKAW